MRKQTPAVVFQPFTHQGLQRGIDQIVKAVQPTLGPLPRTVAIDRLERGRIPELLDSGGLIARRITELPERDSDTGAMFARHILWRVHEAIGDGTVTTAVLLQSIFDQGVRYLAAGGNAMILRHHLEQGMHLITNELEKMTIPVSGKQQLAQVAESICHDPHMAALLGEIFHIIGEHGRIDIRTGYGKESKREYIAGRYWDSELFSMQFGTYQRELKVEMPDATILISDLEIEHAHELVPILDMVTRSGEKALLIIANKVSSSALGLLASVNKNTDAFQTIAVKTPGKTPLEQAEAMEDLAILTGGQPLYRLAGESLARFKPENLGRARSVWANRNYVGITGGKGDARALRSKLAELLTAYEQRTETTKVRMKLQNRIGRLLGGVASLQVGGATELEIAGKKGLAARTANVLRCAVRDGIVPGGGLALLACQPVLERRLGECTDSCDEKAAYRILVTAMEAPIRTIINNAGYSAGEMIAKIKLSREGWGLDLRSGQIVNLIEVGVWDVTGVLKVAVNTAISGAALALTIDTLVHRRNPIQTMQP